MAAVALPQVDRATLTGTVTDASRAALAGAKVTAVHRSQGLQREVTASQTGAYVIPQLPIGPYTVTVEAAGFKTVRYEDMVLQVGETRTLDATLEVAPITAEVEVVATSPALDRSSAEVGSVVQDAQVRQLPLNGRHWTGLMLLAPGAINTGTGNQLSIRFVGRARDDNNWTFDGIDATGVKDPRQNSDIRLVISVDAIAEFKVSSTLYSAESGGGAGAQIHVASKSGSNNLHGSLFEFFRNSGLDARNPFDGPRVPPFRLNQFGGNVGGPIKANKAFYFVNYEALRQRQGSTFRFLVPSPALRSSVLRASPALRPVLDAYPHGGVPTRDPNVLEFAGERTRTAKEDSGQVRIDYHFSDRTTLFGRYSVDDALLVLPATINSQEESDTRPSNFALQLQRTFSPSLVNETRLGVNRVPLTDTETSRFDETITIPGLTALNGSDLNREMGTTYAVIDNLSLFQGRHNLKFGGEIRRIHVNVGEGSQINVSYLNLNNFIDNRVEEIAIEGQKPMFGARRTFYFGYLQDEFKLRPNLTINMGLRYEYYTVVQEVRDRMRVFDNMLGFLPPGTPAYAADRNNFAPRLSIAWAPRTLKDKTVIRMGVGTFYGPGQNDDVNASMDSIFDRFRLTAVNVPGLSYPIAPFFAQARSTGLAPRALQRDRRDLYTNNWSFSIQQQMPQQFVTNVAYVGGSAHKLTSRIWGNTIDPVTGQRPLPAFSQTDDKGSFGNGSFNALQVSVRRPMTRGLLWQTEYMWSHAINDGNTGGGEGRRAQNVRDRRAEKGNGPFDIRHTLTTNIVWQLPIGPGKRFWQATGVAGKLLEGWDLSVVHQARTGRPVNIVVSRSSRDLLDGNSREQRPDLVPGASIYPATKTLNNWLNPAAFTTPARFQWGNLGRHVARGPGVNQWDVALQKTTSVNERHKLAFRAEFFNLFNRPHFGDPGANITATANFGRITGPFNRTIGTGTARQVQLILRYEF